ncbi:MAG: carboxypeptidase-like regulatory domain-containing protein [Bacteroidetes bacterium]|nr:carboxypeptidase-like regulatory domain-containing protein [Bacteroidota bacterium]
MRLVTLCFLLLFGGLIHAQDYITISGNVIDQNSGKPIEFAHVGIPERGIGTISGAEGHFTLKLHPDYVNSTFTVSFLGYSTYRKKVSEIDGPLTVRLSAKALSLIEVVVMEEAAVENIIRKAVNAIPDNYPTKSTRMTGFYRESKTDENQEYTYLAEGVLDIYKTSYRNDKEGQVALKQGRQVGLLPEEEMSRHTVFSSGHLAGHRFDFVKHREEFIDEENFEHYKYWLEGMTFYDDNPVYIIAFDADDSKGRMKGKVFIDTLNYAFVRAEFEVLPQGLKKSNDYPLYVGNWTANRYVVNYRKLGENWQFSSALREGKWRDGGVYSNDILITEVETDRSKPIEYLDRLNRGVPFMTITGNYNEDFWKEYNTTPLSSGLEESVNQMKARQKAEEVFDIEYMAELQRQRDSIQAAEIAAQMEAREAGGTGDSDQAMELPDIPRLNPFKIKLSYALSGGVHLLESGPEQLKINYLHEESGEQVLSLTDTIPYRPQEYIWKSDLALYVRKNLYVHWGISRDFWNSIYKENSIGLGTSVNVSHKRPVFLRLTADYSWMKYGRKLGQTTNEYGNFKAEGKKFKSEKVNLYYGELTHNFKASLELSVEMHPSLELFVRGSYLLPFAENSHIYLWERKRFFRKKVRVKDDALFEVTQNGEPFNKRMTSPGTIQLTVGAVFK